MQSKGGGMERGIYTGLIQSLSRLGVATLSGFLGVEQLERLDSLGLDLGASTLAEFMVSENGVDVFRNRDLRLEILVGLPKEALVAHFGMSAATLGDSVVAMNRFNWGDNQSSREFLALLGIDPLLLCKPVVDRSSSFQLQVEHPLHRYQNWLRKQIVDELLNGSSPRFLLHMPTGSGKTRTSLESLIDHVRSLKNTDVTLVWFAHSDELCEQACESISYLWAAHGAEEAQLIKLWGGRESVSLKPGVPKFVVTSFQTAYKCLVYERR